ncbi:MAG: FAD-dependent oxidoreductase, partial [Actinomycetia bacterium]|nr:FAD-dependent oxidoreductase [Actinomycetes bacterium]
MGSWHTRVPARDCSGSLARYSRRNKGGAVTQPYDLVIIGGGAAGLVAAHTAISVGATVALVEGARMGGDCLWTGCVPS